MRRIIRKFRRMGGMEVSRPRAAFVSALAVLGFVLGAVHLVQHRLADEHSDALACVQCSIAASAYKIAPASAPAVAAPIESPFVRLPAASARPTFDGRPQTHRSRSPPDLRQPV